MAVKSVGRASDLMSRPARRARMAWHSTSPAAMVQPDTAAARSTGCRSSMAVLGCQPGTRGLAARGEQLGWRRSGSGGSGDRRQRESVAIGATDR